MTKKDTLNYEYCPSPTIKVKSARRIGYGANKNSLQDTLLLHEEWIEDGHLFGILDGFGPHGRAASEFLANYLFTKIEGNRRELFSIRYEKEIGDILKDILKDIENMLKESEIDCSESGTCILCLLIIRNKGFIINLGNSRAVIFSESPQITGLTQLTKDHNAEDESEQKRINKQGGKTRKIVLPSGDEIGSNRIWLDSEKPGFTTTRALGGFKYKKILSSEPDIIKIELTASDKFITLASDGVWDVMKNEEVVEFIQTTEPDSEDNIAESLIKEAFNRWDKLIKRPKEYHLGVGDDPNNINGADDVSVIVLYLQFPSKAGTDGLQ